MQTRFLFPGFFRFLCPSPIGLLGLLWLLVSTGSAQAGHQTGAPLVTQISSVTSVTATPVSLTLTPTSTTVCSGASVPLSLSGCPTTGSISWSTGQTGATISVKPTQTSSYTATCQVSGPLGSTTTASATITVLQSATITASPSASVVCEGTPVQFSVSAVSSTSIAYAWYRNGVALTDTSANKRQLTLPAVTPGANNGTYTAVVTNQCGSVTSSAARLTVSPRLVITNAVTPATCAGTSTGQIVANVTGGLGERQYQTNGGAFQTSNLFSNLRAGIYSIVVKDSLGCTARTTAEVQQPTSISLTIRAVAAKCASATDGGAIVTASGGNGTYLYQLNGGPTQTSNTFVDLKANTTYTISVTDQRGCAASQSVLIGAPDPFAIKATVTATRCAGSADGSVNVAASGGVGSYQYQLGNSPFQTGTLFTGLSATTYTITVRDGNGCLGTQTVTVQQPPALNLSVSTTPTNCYGANSGSITVTPSGGTGAVFYQLTTLPTPQSSNVFQKVAAGDYTVVATDNNGCTAIATVSVGKAEPLDLRAATVPATCCVCATGGVILATSGGSGTGRSFQLLEQPFQASNQFGRLRPGTYQFRVADEAGCFDTVSAVVTDASAMMLSVGRVKDIACAGGRDGEAAVQLTGGTKPVTFYWQTERRDTLKARTSTQTGLAAGTYTVSAVDSNRCTTATVFVTVRTLSPIPPQPTVTQISNVLSVTEITGVQWYFKADTGVARPLPNATQSTIVPLQSGQYYVIVTANGCASMPSNVVRFVLTALPEPGATLLVRVVPNPVVGRLRLEFDQPDRQAVQIRLIDTLGKPQLEHRIPAFVGKHQAEYPLLGVPPGVYLLRAEAGNRQATIRVLVE